MEVGPQDHRTSGVGLPRITNNRLILLDMRRLALSATSNACVAGEVPECQVSTHGILAMASTLTETSDVRDSLTALVCVATKIPQGSNHISDAYLGA